MYVLQIKMIQCIPVKSFQPRLTLNFLCLLAIIIHELGLGDKEN